MRAILKGESKVLRRDRNRDWLKIVNRAGDRMSEIRVAAIAERG